MLSIVLIISVLCLLFILFKRVENLSEYEYVHKSGLSYTASLWLKQLRFTNSEALDSPPVFPGSLPIIGHLHKALLLSSNIFNLFRVVSEECDKQGGVTVARLGRVKHYLITDPQDASTAAKFCLRRHYVFEFAKRWQGNNVAIVSGETWKHHRKLLNPAFSLPVIHGFLDVFNNQAKKLLVELEPLVGKGPFDHSSYLVKNNFETLCAGTFGIDAISETLHEKYVKSAYEMIDILKARLLKIWLQIDFIYKLSGLQKKEEQLVENLHSLTNTVLEQKKLARDAEALPNTITSTSGLEYKPFLDLLLDLSAKGAFTEKEVKEQTEAILTTGFETTANQLTFILLLLGAHPEVQEKLHQELVQVLGADGSVGKDDVNKLVYTNAVIMESLRVLPTIPAILRCVDQDVKLKNCTMRAGSYCVMLPFVSNISAKDVKGDEFRPERWLDSDYNGNQDFAGFGLGKRGCIGKTYAMVAMKVMLAHFIRRYRVHGDMSNLQLSADFVLKPISGHEISIERRNSTVA